MNIFLVPYSWHRHLVMGWWCAAAGLCAWWLVQCWVIGFGVDWGPGTDGYVMLSCMGIFIASANTFGELSLRRAPIRKRIWKTLLSGLVTGASILLCWWLWKVLVHLFFDADVHGRHIEDPTLVSLSYRWGLFLLVGLSTGFGPLCMRRFEGVINHLCGGMGAVVCGALCWHLLGNSTFGTDLYLASMVLGVVWGFVFGALVWGIPADLYAGWLRVLNGNRYSLRIPIDRESSETMERFVGHYPHGLDLYLTPESGVSELHLSVAVDNENRYFARGLSLRPTLVSRFLEKVDLRYDPRRPAPLETRLESGDIIRIGTDTHRAELEFIMLPKEER